MKFSVRKFLKSFVYAVRGVLDVLKEEQNFKVHLFVAMWVILFGVLFGVSPSEWCVLLLTISLVLTSEILNTALEKLCDLIHPEQNETVRVIKDVSAGMVLLCAIGALLIGIVIFLPKLTTLLI